MWIETEDLWKLLLALSLGGLLGWERQLHDKPAGFRTNVLICIGSALFTILSVKIGNLHGSDPSRIAAQIVTGIGFLGAGAIIRHGEAVLGLTTAATIWLVASVGVGVGAGYYAISAIGAVLALCVLLVFRGLENLADQFHHVRAYSVALLPDDEAQKQFSNTLSSYKLKILSSKKMKSGGRYFYEMTLSGRRSEHETFLDQLFKSPTVKEVKY